MIIILFFQSVTDCKLLLTCTHAHEQNICLKNFHDIKPLWYSMSNVTGQVHTGSAIDEYLPFLWLLIFVLTNFWSFFFTTRQSVTCLRTFALLSEYAI